MINAKSHTCVNTYDCMNANKIALFSAANNSKLKASKLA